MAERPPFLAVPYPGLDYVLSLPGDHAKVFLRVAQLARAAPGTVDGIALDAGEALISLRSRKVWGRVALDAEELTDNGVVALRRRALARLERDGWVALRTAHRSSTGDGTESGTRSGTPATIVRFLKFRDILWPASVETAHPTAHPTAQEPAHQNGTIPPVEAPPAVPPEQQPARALEAAPTPEAGLRWPKAVAFRQALTDSMARTVLYPVGGNEPVTWTSLEASLDTIPEGDAVELCRERILRQQAAGKRAGGNLAYFAQVLADEVLRRRRFAPKQAARRTPPGPPAWTELVGRVAEHLHDDRDCTCPRCSLYRDLCACTAVDVCGALAITPPDVFVALRLREMYPIADVAAGAIPGLAVRLLEPLARAAGGSP